MSPYSKDLPYPPLDGPGAYTPRALADFWKVQTPFVSALITYGRLPTHTVSDKGRVSIATADVILWMNWNGHPLPKGQEKKYRDSIRSALGFRKGSRWLAENKALDKVAKQYADKA